MAPPKITVEASMPRRQRGGHRGAAAAGAVGDGGAGWNDISYVSNTQAWVVYGPADFSDIGQLWVTHDSGQHWAPVKL